MQSPYWILSALTASLLAAVAVVGLVTTAAGSNFFEQDLGNTTVGRAFLPVALACAVVLAWALMRERRRGVSREHNLAAANIELLRKEVSLERQSISDPVTGLYNRRFLYERLGGELRRAQRYGRPLSIILLSLGHFRGINDDHTDLLLSQFTRVLSENLREPDIPCRFGGEEFAIVLPETGHEQTLAVANKLLRHLKESEPATESEGQAVTISQGVAAYPSADISNENDMIQKAERALDEAKASGDDRIAMAEAVAPDAAGPARRVGPLM